MLYLKTKLRAYLLFAIACCTCIPAAHAQLPNSVDVSLHQVASDTLEVRLTANGADFNQVFSALVVSLQWKTSAGISIGTVDQQSLPNLCPLITMPFAASPAGVVQNGVYNYQNYTIVGTSQIGSCTMASGFQLTDGIPLTIARIPFTTSGSCPEIKIANDPFTTASNYAYFVSLNGSDKTGIINSVPVSGPTSTCDDGDPNTYYDYLDLSCNCIGLTADCNGVPNGPALPGLVCNDGDPLTQFDTYDASCNCTGISTDCEGVIGGTALPGQACNDWNSSTGLDTWDASCNCSGLPYDCVGIAGGAALPGTSCDDGDPSTTNDIWDVNCNCIGLEMDCTGITGGPNLPGTPCDDNDPLTANDTWNPNCVCIGILIDCNGVPGGTALPGSACNDGNVLTIQDTLDVNCNCAGIPADCEGTISGTALPGTACDDNDPTTSNDMWNANCNCAGLAIDCTGVLGGANVPGAPCNDNDPITVNDTWDANCVCAGLWVDCNGIIGGPALPGSSCNDGNVLTMQDTLDGSCNCVGIAVDCQGTVNGTALPGTPCDDNDPNTSNDIWDANCNCSPSLHAICLYLDNSPRKPADVEESINGSIYADASAFDLVYDSEAPWHYRGDQFTGLHYSTLPVPANASIIEAYVQFTTYDTVNYGPTLLTISGELSLNSLVFDYTAYSLSTRPNTISTVPWSPAEWNVLDENGLDQRTPNLAPIIQELVDQAGWNGGGLSLFFQGTGGRQAYSSDQDPSRSAQLCITYSTISLAPDCEGIQGGPSTQGNTCDDGDPSTGGDTWNSDCICEGTPLDCSGILNGSALPGTNCDDGDPATGSDVYQSDCSCAGQLIDCTGLAGGGALPGTICDDGDASTNFDRYDNDCICSGVSNTQSLCFSMTGASDPDSEEASNGGVYQNAGSLDLVYDSELPWNWRGDQQVALRFSGVPIPNGVSVLDAYIQFTAGGTVNYNPIQLNIAGEASDNALALSYGVQDVSSRLLTNSQVGWSPSDWLNMNESGTDQRSPNLSAIVQELVNRPGWSGANSMAFIVSGYGGRQAYSFNQDASKAPVLCITYTTDVLVLDCEGVAGGPAVPGTPCNDNDPSTANDQYDVNCQCAGDLVDCSGVINGTALPGTICDDGDPTTGNDQYDTNCNCSGLPIDCAGIPGGNAVLDDCGVCNGTNDCLGSLVCHELSFNGDQEEASNGGVYANAGALDLIFDSELPWHWRGEQHIGLHFNSLNIPAGAVITEAVLQFTAQGTINYGPCSLNIRAEASDDAAPISWLAYDISSRPTTSNVSWSPAPWSSVDEVGLEQRTPDLGAIIQEVVDRPGWTSGNSMLFVIDGTGGRQAYSSEQNVSKAAKLCLSWEMPSTFNDPGADAGDRSLEAPHVRANFYPNPNRGDVLFMDIANELPEACVSTIQIMDLFGKVIFSKRIIVSAGHHHEMLELDMAVVQGVYLVSVLINDQLISERLVIQ